LFLNVLFIKLKPDNIVIKAQHNETSMTI